MKIKFKCEDKECSGFLRFLWGNDYGCMHQCEICKKFACLPTKEQIRRYPKRCIELLKNNRHIILGKERSELIVFGATGSHLYDERL